MDGQTAALFVLQRKAKLEGGLEIPAHGTTAIRTRFLTGPLRGMAEEFQLVCRADGKLQKEEGGWQIRPTQRLSQLVAAVRLEPSDRVRHQVPATFQDGQEK